MSAVALLASFSALTHMGDSRKSEIQQARERLTENRHAGCNQCFMPGLHRRPQETVMRYTDSRDPYREAQPTGTVSAAWLSRRSIESWASSSPAS